jgi:hypothetical protein
MEKIIAIRLKPLLSSIINREQFGFLHGNLIQEAIGSTQEGILSIKTHRHLVSVFKIKKIEAYYHAYWI